MIAEGSSPLRGGGVLAMLAIFCSLQRHIATQNQTKYPLQGPRLDCSFCRGNKLHAESITMANSRPVAWAVRVLPDSKWLWFFANRQKANPPNTKPDSYQGKSRTWRHCLKDCVKLQIVDWPYSNSNNSMFFFIQSKPEVTWCKKALLELLDRESETMLFAQCQLEVYTQLV